METFSLCEPASVFFYLKDHGNGDAAESHPIAMCPYLVPKLYVNKTHRMDLTKSLVCLMKSNLTLKDN